MKKLYSLYAIVLLLFISSTVGIADIQKNTQNNMNIPSDEWTMTYGGLLEDGAEYVQPTNDNGYIITGYTYSYSNGESDLWLIKTDSEGNMIWNKSFGGSSWDHGFSVRQTIDNGYIIVGYTLSYGAGDEDVWLIKTDSSGNKIWDKTFGGSGFDEGREIQVTKEGGYIIIGTTKSYGSGDNDFWLIKTDSYGNKLWNKTFGGDYDDYGYSVHQTSSGGYILTGYTTSKGAGSGDVWLVRTDVNGKKLWDKTFGGNGWDRGRSVRQTTDGGYIIAGSTFSYGVGGDIWILKTDISGTLEWQMNRGQLGEDRGRSVRQTSDQGYIITGFRYSATQQSNDLWLIKLDKDGNRHWNTTISGDDWDRGICVEQTSDNGFIIAGYTKSYGEGDRNAWLVKTAPGNNPPYKPSKPGGQVNGEPGETYRYTTNTSDFDGDDIYYLFDWGDGTDTGWLGPYISGETARISHEWVEKGNYNIKVKAKDDPNGDGNLSDGEESIWSEPLSISMPKTKIIQTPFLDFLENHPHLFPFLRQILLVL